MYPDYAVKNIESYKELVIIMQQEHASDIAFSYPGGEMRYSELAERIYRFAGGIAELDCQKIRLDLDNVINFAAAYIAVVLVGKTAVLGEFSHPVSEDTMKMDDANYSLYLSKEPIALSDLPESDVNAVCTVLHSSGTSSAPKGIMLSQKNLCSDVVGGLQKYSMRKGDRFISLIPHYHAFGLVCDLLGPFLVGATVYVLEDKKRFFAEMAQIRPTMINVPPAIAETLLKLIQKTGNADVLTGGNLRKILCGGAGLRADIARGLRKYGVYAYGCYGLSECSPCVAVNRDEYYKDGSAGVALNCNTIKIAEDGEILIVGTNVMIGYYNDWRATSERIVDGVLYTGDLGYIDEDGFLFVTGRKSNLIVFSDGTKCSPEELEEQIVTHTSAEEAWVYQSDTEGRSFLRARIYLPDLSKKASVIQYIETNLIRYRFDRIDFIQEPLPKNAAGKIRREV